MEAGKGSLLSLIDTNKPIALVDDCSDDNYMLKHEIKFLFGETRIITFRCGESLLHYLQHHEAENDIPGLILLDLHMCGMDGAQTLDYLRSRPRFANIPVIAVSGTANRSEIFHVMGQGAQGFLPKPVSRNQLVRALHGESVTPPCGEK